MGVFILLSLNQHSSHKIFNPRFYTLVKLDLEVHIPPNWTKAMMIHGDVLCLIKVSWRKLSSYSGQCRANREPEWETNREFPIQRLTIQFFKGKLGETGNPTPRTHHKTKRFEFYSNMKWNWSWECFVVTQMSTNALWISWKQETRLVFVPVHCYPQKHC